MVIKIPKPVFYCSLVGTCCAGALLCKEYFGGERYEGKEPADGKTVIITGANCGIGRETALELAKRKAKVIMACRSIEKCEKAREDIVMQTLNKHVYCRLCDLASQSSIRTFAERFKAENERLDILINNAGVMSCPASKTEEGIEMQLGVNHMGHFLLTNLLLDRLKESAPSRVVNVSCIAHKRGKIDKNDLNGDSKKYNGDTAYNQSKLANVLFTTELAKRLKGTEVTVNAVNPGIVDTEITRHLGYHDSYLASVSIKPIVWCFIKRPKQGAQAVIHASLSPDLEKVSGKYFSNHAEDKMSEEAQDETTAQWLWLVSEKWTRLTSQT